MLTFLKSYSRQKNYLIVHKNPMLCKIENCLQPKENGVFLPFKLYSPPSNQTTFVLVAKLHGNYLHLHKISIAYT